MSPKEIELLQQELALEKTAKEALEQQLNQKEEELQTLHRDLESVHTYLSNYIDETVDFYNVFDNIIDSYILFDLSGYVLKMNRPAKDFFGYDIDKESFRVTNIIHQEDKNTLTPLLINY